jgi:hypothetical protein
MKFSFTICVCFFIKHDIFFHSPNIPLFEGNDVKLYFTLIVIWYLSLLCSFFLGEFVFQNG